jgi:Domain of Unknown Function (DUF748)
MFSLKNPRIAVWSLRIAVSLIALIVVFWGCCHLFLPDLLKKSAAEFGEKIGYDIAYRDVSLSPFRLRVEIDGLHLAKEGGNKLLDFKKLIITLKWSKLVLGEIGFDEIILEGPKLLVERGATKSHGTQATWNWQEFIHAVQKSLPPKDPDISKKPQKVSIDEFLVTDGALALVDESSSLKEELKPFSIKLLDVANYDQNGVVSGVRGQYDFNLGSLQLLIPGLNKSVAFAHVAISGGLDNPSPNQLGAQLDLQLDDGSIRSHWDLNTASKAIEGKITLANIATAPLIALLPANKELLGTSGSLNADLLLKLGNEAEMLSGNAQLAHLAVLEKGEKTPLILWDAAEIHQFEYKSSKTPGAKAATLAIDEVLIDHPVLRFEINNQGLSNFRRLFSKPQTEQKPVDAPVVTSAKPKATDGFGLDIRSVNLKGGEVFFTDLAMRPNFKVDVKKFNATFLGVSNAPGRFATVAMDGVVANSGSLRAKGQASFDDPRRNHDILMSFKNLPLTTFNPAVMTYAGYHRAKDGQLNGSNQIIIKNVQLGDEVPDFQGKKLPLGLAIALLEDSDDTIDVTIRIAGNVDSPQFSASGLVWQAISNVLTNVATAPFRALASILGMGGDEGINAVPGEAVFLPADQDRLEKFGEYLVKRPNSSMEIIGTYDPVQDKQEMARAKADGAILKDAGFKIEPGEPIPTPSFSDPRVQSGLKAAYAQYIGRIKLGQRLLMLPDGEARNEQLHSELIAGIEITNAELQSLAKNRAQAAYAFMVKENPSLTDRITIGDVRAVEAGKEGIPLDVELRIK